MHKFYSNFNILVILLVRFLFGTEATSGAISTIPKYLFPQMRRKQIGMKARSINYPAVIKLFQHHKNRYAQHYQGVFKYSAPRDGQ